MSVAGEYIERLESALESGSYDEQKALVEETVATFSERIPTIKKELDRYKGRVAVLGPYSSYTPPVYDYKGDIRKLVGKLRLYQESSSAGDERKDDMVRNINVYANPTMSQVQNVTMGVTVSQVMEKVAQDGLSAEEVSEIRALLEEADKNRGDESRLRKVGKKIVDFAFDKAVSSLPMLLSYVAGLFPVTMPA